MSSAAKVIREAARAGFDLALIDSSLALTPEERVRQHSAALELVEALRGARRTPNAKHRTTPAKAR